MWAAGLKGMSPQRLVASGAARMSRLSMAVLEGRGLALPEHVTGVVLATACWTKTASVPVGMCRALSLRYVCAGVDARRLPLDGDLPKWAKLKHWQGGLH